MPRTFLVRRSALQIQSSSTESEDETFINSSEVAVIQETDNKVDDALSIVPVLAACTTEADQTPASPRAYAVKNEYTLNSPTYLSRAVSSAIRVDTVTGVIENNTTLLENIVKQENVDSDLDAEVAYHTDRSFSSYSSDKPSFCRSASITSTESTGSNLQHSATYSDISETSFQESGKVPLSLPLTGPHQPLPPFASLAYNVFAASRMPLGETMSETITMENERSSVMKLPLRLPLQIESVKEIGLIESENKNCVSNTNVKTEVDTVTLSTPENTTKDETENEKQKSNDVSKTSTTKSAPKIWNPFHHVSTPKAKKVLPVSLNTNTHISSVVNNVSNQQSPALCVSPFARNTCVPPAGLISTPLYMPEYRSPSQSLNYNITELSQSPHFSGITNSFQTIPQINANVHNIIPAYSPRISSPFLPFKHFHTPGSHVSPSTITPSRMSTPVLSPIPTTPVVKVNEVPNITKGQKRTCSPVMETPKRIRTDNLPFKIFKESPSPSFDPSVVKFPYTCAVTPVLKHSAQQQNLTANVNRTPLSHLQPLSSPQSRSPVVLGQTSFSKENIPHLDSKENSFKNQQTQQNIEMINGGYGIKNPAFVPPRPSDITNIQKDKNGIGNFACKVCGKEFSIQRLLNRHLKCHSESKRYLCTFCGKGFNDTFDLKRHTRIHTGVKPYKCQHCEKAFTQRCSLESHSRKVHSMEMNFAYKQRRSKTYVCEDCGHSTMDPEVHFNHLKERHPNCPTLAKPHDKRHFKFQSNDRPSSGPLRPRN